MEGKCWYVCARLCVLEVVEELSGFIDSGEYDKAIELVNGLELEDVGKEMLVMCVLSYKRSC